MKPNVPAITMIARSGITSVSLCCILLITSHLQKCEGWLSPSTSSFIAQQQQIQRTISLQAPTPPADSIRGTPGRRTTLLLAKTRNQDNDGKKKNSRKRKKSAKSKKKSASPPSEPSMSKADLVKAVGESMRRAQKSQKAAAAAAATAGAASLASGDASNGEEEESSTVDTTDTSDGGSSPNLLDRFNPFKAGQSLRKTIDSALTNIPSATEGGLRDSLYYLDDRLELSANEGAFSGLGATDYVPEVLVVGAKGPVGELVVRRLLRANRFRVRVLVRDLYTDTLQRFGTGVTYCQGDLANVDSLEYALTDVDKIVFCPEPPPSLTAEELENPDSLDALEAFLEARVTWAEQVDWEGVRNVVQAYQDVRHADYGTSQAAKRTLFKFQRNEDFNLFAIDYDTTTIFESKDEHGENFDQDDYDDYEDDGYVYNEDLYDLSEYDDYEEIESRRDDAVDATTQVQWIRSRFNSAVFVGRIPSTSATGATGGQASVITSRLRSRDDPDSGIDLSTAFGGLILRVCSDGGVYEAFVRTGAYEEMGVEYVCPFSTETKTGDIPLVIGSSTRMNKSRNKFTTVRLPFENFKPVQVASNTDSSAAPLFRGQDVRQIGFRYRAAAQPQQPVAAGFSTMSSGSEDSGELKSFYMALSYVKLFRSQPEPEFVYVSDARVPSVVKPEMVRHDMKRLLVSSSDTGGPAAGVSLLDERVMEEAAAAVATTASPSKTSAATDEEVYYKYRGEEVIKRSGLAYSIVRVNEYEEENMANLDAGRDLAVSLWASEADSSSEPVVSRDQVAEVCVGALLDPNALNKSFYIRRKPSSPMEPSLTTKFQDLPRDTIS